MSLSFDLQNKYTTDNTYVCQGDLQNKYANDYSWCVKLAYISNTLLIIRKRAMTSFGVMRKAIVYSIENRLLCLLAKFKCQTTTRTWKTIFVPSLSVSF